jgi:hypothetical protein
MCVQQGQKTGKSNSRLTPRYFKFYFLSRRLAIYPLNRVLFGNEYLTKLMELRMSPPRSFPKQCVGLNSVEFHVSTSKHSNMIG